MGISMQISPKSVKIPVRPDIDSLKPLNIIELQILESGKAEDKIVQFRLKCLYEIFIHRDIYFKEPQYKKYKYKFTKYVVDKFSGVLKSGCYDYANAIRLIAEYDRPDVLEMDIPDLLYKLSKIYYLSEKRKQSKLIKNINEITREDILKENNKITVDLDIQVSTGLGIFRKLSKTGDTLKLKGPKESLELIDQIVNMINSESDLKAVFRYLSGN